MPKTPLARSPARFLSASFSTTPSSVIMRGQAAHAARLPKAPRIFSLKMFAKLLPQRLGFVPFRPRLTTSQWPETAPEVHTQWVRYKHSPFSSLSTPLKVDFQGSRVASDGGLILVRELDERLRWPRERDEDGSLAKSALRNDRAPNHPGSVGSIVRCARRRCRIPS